MAHKGRDAKKSELGRNVKCLRGTVGRENGRKEKFLKKKLSKVLFIYKYNTVFRINDYVLCTPCFMYT